MQTHTNCIIIRAFGASSPYGKTCPILKDGNSSYFLKIQKSTFSKSSYDLAKLFHGNFNYIFNIPYVYAVNIFRGFQSPSLFGERWQLVTGNNTDNKFIITTIMN